MQQQPVQFRFPRLTPTVKKLLIVQAVVFVAFAVIEKLGGVPMFGLFSLDVPALSLLGAEGGPAFPIQLLWQPFTFWLTYPAVPKALTWIGFAMLGIYFFLCPFEEAYGTKRVLQLAAIGVLGAAIPCLLFGLVLTAPLPTFGASSIALAALGAFAAVARGRKIAFMFILPMNTWTVIGLGIGLSALNALLADNPFVFIEHVGGLFVGYGFARWITRPRTVRPAKKPRRNGPNLRVVKGGEDDDKPRWLN